MPSDLDPQSEAALVEALEDYHQRTALGEAVPLGLYQEQLGARFPDFQAVLRAEQALDDAMAPPNESPAEVLPRPFGPFTLVRELGRGGVGVVYEAVDRRLGRTLAVKILKLSFDTDDVALERFRREASACARVRHDHIVPIFESGEIEGQPYYAMDLVPGVALADLIRDGRAPPPRDLCRELAHVADALAALHAEGVIHRDVKPHNLMVRPDGRMVLTDFGLARTTGAGTLTQTGQALGTPLYMSPEQIYGDGNRIAPTTDVYGLGAVLYEALTGHPPFPMTEYPRLIYSVLNVRPEPPRSVNPAVPEACERIALKALEKEPRDRYPTASALATDLRAFADERPVLGHPVSRPTRAWRWVTRRRVPIGIAALALLGVLYWWAQRPATFEFDDEGFPVAALVKINGAEVGRTPPSLLVSRPAGLYEIRVERDGFEPVQRRWTVAAGETRTFPLVLVPANLEAIAAMRAFLGIAQPNDVGTRAPGDSMAVSVIVPQGDVTLEDLHRGWFVDVDRHAFREGGWLVLRRGSEELWRLSLGSPPAGAHLLCGAFPTDVLSELRAAENLELAWLPPPTAPRAASAPVAIHVRADRPESMQVGKIGRLEGLSGGRGELVWTQLRAEALAQDGAKTAAFHAAVALASADLGRATSWDLLARLLGDLAPGVPLHMDVTDHLTHGRPAPALCVPDR